MQRSVFLNVLASEIEAISENTLHDRFAAMQGMVVELAGPVRSMRVGTRLDIEDAGYRGASGVLVAREVVGFRGDLLRCRSIRLMAFAWGAARSWPGIYPSDPSIYPSDPSIYPSDQ